MSDEYYSFSSDSDEAASTPQKRGKGAKIGQHDRSRDKLQAVHSATRPLLKSTVSTTNPLPYTIFSSIAYFRIHSPSNLMPLVRSQRDEFHLIGSDPDVTSIERWRVSTSHSRRSSDLRSSLKPTSRNPRFSSKTASWPTAAHRVVRLERVQEDEEDDGHSTYQPGLPQIPMETNVSGFCLLIVWGLLRILQDQIDVSAGAYVSPVGHRLTAFTRRIL